MVTAIRTTCKKGKKEWDGNNSSGGRDKREGRKDCLKKIKRGVWGGGRSYIYIAVVVLNVGASEYYRFTSKGAQKQCCCLCMQRKYF